MDIAESNVVLTVTEDRYFEINQNFIYGLGSRFLGGHCEVKLYEKMAAAK